MTMWQTFSALNLSAGEKGSFGEFVTFALERNPCLPRGVFEGLFQFGAADRIPRVGQAFVKVVALRPRLSDSQYRRAKAMAPGNFAGPHQVLGLRPGATDKDLKARHHELAEENHLDPLAARGVLCECDSIANRQLAGLSATFNKIVEERGP
jgi:DnaJ like chaperone protein